MSLPAIFILAQGEFLYMESFLSRIRKAASESFIHHHLNYFLPTIYTIADWIMILLAERLAYAIRVWLLGNHDFHIAWMNAYIAFPLFFILFLRQGQIYQKQMSWWKLMERIFYGCTYAISSIVVLVYATHIAASTSRLFIGLLWPLSFGFIVFSRYMINHLLAWAGVGKIPFLLVGGGKTARLLIDGIKKDVGLSYHVVGYVDDAGPQEIVGEREYLGTFSDIESVIRQTQVKDVMIAAPGLSPEKLDQLLHKVTPLVRNVFFIPDLIGLPLNGVEVEPLFHEQLLLMGLRNNLARRYNRIIKRIFDLTLTIIGGTLLLPVFAFIAIIIKLDSPGPVFFAHERIGKNGQLFPCFKFRTMCENADVQLRTYLRQNPEARKEWNAEFKLKNDPRITRVGKVLRRTSLDELPQIWNVVRGEMSLVGPRPIVREEISKYGNYINDFYSVHPGITGMWQVNGRSDTTYEQRVQMDSWYVRNWSVWLDIMLLWKTFGAVTARKGAY